MLPIPVYNHGFPLLTMIQEKKISNNHKITEDREFQVLSRVYLLVMFFNYNYTCKREQPKFNARDY